MKKLIIAVLLAGVGMLIGGSAKAEPADLNYQLERTAEPNTHEEKMSEIGSPSDASTLLSAIPSYQIPDPLRYRLVRVNIHAELDLAGSDHFADAIQITVYRDATVLSDKDVYRKLFSPELAANTITHDFSVLLPVSKIGGNRSHAYTITASEYVSFNIAAPLQNPDSDVKFTWDVEGDVQRDSHGNAVIDSSSPDVVEITIKGSIPGAQYRQHFKRGIPFRGEVLMVSPVPCRP